MTSHSSRATSILISDPAQLCSARLPVPGPPPPLSPFPPFSPPLSLCSVLSVIPQNTRAPIILRCNPVHLSSFLLSSAKRKETLATAIMPVEQQQMPQEPAPAAALPTTTESRTSSEQPVREDPRFPFYPPTVQHPFEVVYLGTRAGWELPWLRRRSVMPMLGVERPGRTVAGLAGPIAGTNRAAIVPSSPTSPPLRATQTLPRNFASSFLFIFVLTPTDWFRPVASRRAHEGRRLGAPARRRRRRGESHPVYTHGRAPTRPLRM